jgi:probable 2-oxoglutarate dehydrogenase E1 component DHKTD1
MESQTRFKPVISDPVNNATTASRLVFLSGKLFYDLVKERATRKLDDKVALIRIEELAPFPFGEVKSVLESYSQVKEIMFLQEEPRNQGAWEHVSTRLKAVLEATGFDGELVYKGRKGSALPAPGIGKLYRAQQEEVLKSAFEGI